MKKIFFLSFLLMSILNQYAQTITLTFTAKDAANQNSIALDSVHVHNQTIGCDTTLYGSSPSVVIPFVVGVEENGSAHAFGLLPTMPNPFNGVTTVSVYLTAKSQLTMLLTDNLGKQLAAYTGELAAGNHRFQLQAGKPGLLLLNVLNGNDVRSLKLVNTSTAVGVSSLRLLESSPQVVKNSVSVNSTGFEYFQGDILQYTGMATGFEDETIQDSPTTNTSYTFLMAANVTLATVITTAVTDITLNTAISGGNVISDGGATVTARGVCWSTTPNPTTASSHTTDGSGLGAFVSNITGLVAGTLYYVRSYATNSVGTSYGDELWFNTLDLPTVITNTPVDITHSTATSGGNVTSDGGATVTARGVCWSNTTNPVATGNHTTDGSGTGTFVSNITGLTAGTQYYVRAYATNSVGTAYGNELSFTTLALPTVSTTALSNIAATTATSGGNVSAEGGAAVTARGVCWATTPNPLATGSHTTDGSGTGTFVSNITGLTAGTLYYVRAYATSSVGTAYGNEVSFTTLWACGVGVNVNHVTGAVAPVNKTVAYGTVTNIPGEPAKCWITQNLGSDHQATAVNDATEASAGWYWQFNRKQGYKHDGITLTPTWIITLINENADWLPVNDPCALELGSGWRIPTKIEWTNVDASGGWTNWNGPWNSGLKLHAAAGLGYSDGSLGNRGSYGYYWSSVQYDATNGWYLFFYGSDSYVYTYNKASGFSVRCLRN